MKLSLWAALAALAVAVPAHADEYSKWTFDAAAKRYQCTYTYETKEKKQATQTVVAYPAGNERHGWAYFYNAANKPWAKVATVYHPQYNVNEMNWQKLNAKADAYEAFPGEAVGYCPAPGDGRRAIPLLPDPPK